MMCYLFEHRDFTFTLLILINKTTANFCREYKKVKNSKFKPSFKVKLKLENLYVFKSRKYSNASVRTGL